MMVYPIKVIESEMARLNQFKLTEGCQPTHALFFLKEGEFVLKIDGEEKEMHAGDCIIFPNYVHFQRKILHPIVFVYIKFEFDANLAGTFYLPSGKLEFIDEERLISSIKALEQLQESDIPSRQEIQAHLLMDILLQYHYEKSITQVQNNRPLDMLVDSAEKYITKHLERKLTISDICKAAGTNASTLNLHFQKSYSLSVGQYIIQERIKKAKKLLLGTTCSLLEIAKQCGYDNVYYFSNAFKKKTGVAPTVYRKQSAFFEHKSFPSSQA